MASTLFTQNIIACVWDFDKTLIPDYMQAPLFRRYGIDEPTFWAETNALAENYRKRGYSVAPEISYLNHLLTYVLAGKMPGLGNKVLRECGAEIKFYPGLPKFFESSRAWAQAKPEYVKHEIQLEHYVVSTGLAEMIRGSALAPYIDATWACELIENPLQPGFLKQKEFPLQAAPEIAQLCDRMVADGEAAVASRVTRPPRHLNASPEEEAARKATKQPKQSSFLE